jgi:hypothetical protein
MSPIEKNARRLVGVLVHFPAGATWEDLRKQFEKDTSLNRQSFYNALRYVKEQHWFVGGGSRSQLYTLNSDNSWKEPPPKSIGERLGEMDKDQLEHLAGSQAVQIEDLQGQVESLRDWSSGNNTNGVAVSNLVQIVGNSAASTRQRLKAAAVVLGYRVQDTAVTEFAKRFLESLCANANIPTDYRIEAGELLRRTEDAMIRPPIERRTDNDSLVVEKVEPLAHLVARRRRRQAALEGLDYTDPANAAIFRAWVERPDGTYPAEDGLRDAGNGQDD